MRQVLKAVLRKFTNRWGRIPGLIGVVVLAVFFLGGISLSSAAEKPSRTLTIASFSFPPILHEGVNGEFSGTMWETVKMLCETADLNCNFEIVALKRAYHRIRSGDVDALVTINIGQLKDCCLASDWSSPWSAGFFSTTAKENIPDSQEDLQGKTLIVVNSMKSPYLFAKDLDTMSDESRLTLYKAPHILSAVKMFLKNRAPLLWGGDDFKWYIRPVAKVW